MYAPTPGESKKLVEYLLSDLRQLSTEAKKKHNHVKEAAEAGVVRIRNISSASSESSLLTNLRAASNELLHPLLLACAIRQSKLVQIALQGIQRLVQFRILEPACANVVVSELWNLVEAECEELKVLQTVPQLVSAHLLITSHNLAKCIVMCFRLHFAKDPVVINAASAAVRQVISGVFERVNHEDGVFSNELTVVPSAGGKPSPRSAPPTLRPCAADAYLLFRDLCLVINAEPAIWLVGMREITRTLGLELLETILKNYPGVFFKHSELATMVKQEVCQLIIKLFSPSLKPMNARSSLGGLPAEKPYFPIAMRLVRVVVVLLTNYHQILSTECEIFVSHLIKFVEMDKHLWQKVLALEALHKVVAQTHLLRWMAEQFDSKENSSKLVGSVAECLTNAVKGSFAHPAPRNENEPDGETLVQNGAPGFYYRNTWQPYLDLLTSKKTPFMDSLEKHDAGEVPEGYVISRCCSAVTDLWQSLYSSVDQLIHEESNGQENGSAGRKEVAYALFSSAFSGLFPSVGILLNTSTDETVIDQLLCSLSMVVSMGFRLRAIPETQAALYMLSAASTPTGEYLAIFASLKPPGGCDNVLTDCALPSQKVIAVGSPCPSPFVPPELWNQQIVMTARNLQAAKILLGVLSSHVEAVDEQWYFCISICQQLSWLMAMKPFSNGVFSKEKADADSVLPPVSATPGTVTTAAMSETPMLAGFFDKIFSTSSSLSRDSLTLLLDALIRLSDEQAAVCATGRECSLFPLAGITRVSVVNVHRVTDYWNKSSTHFLKICGHSSTSLRDWAALSLTILVKNAVKSNNKTYLSEEELQKLCYSSLNAMNNTNADEVRKRQLECLMSSMQKDGASLHSSSWPIFIDIVASVVAQDSCSDESLVRQGYLGVRLMSADFLQSLPFSCVPALVEAIARYGSQQADQNISLSALALLWTISDFIYRKAEVIEVSEVEKVWLVLYTCLSELCVDSRHSVRKSACQTLLQTVVAHGHALRAHTWNHMIWQILIPLLEKVRSQMRGASTEKTTKGIIMHHSRDTDQKQWTETCINTLSACCKMYIAQRKVLLKLDDFGAAWEALLSYLEWGACYENAELSLCALKSFQEVLLGRVSVQTLDINTRDRASSSPEAHTTEQIPQLPIVQWVESWNSWNRIARGMAKHTSSVLTSQGLPKGVYVPGPSHLTTLLHIFPPLFTRAAKHIKASELKGDQLPSVMQSLASIPVPGEQAPFVLPSATSHITPTQEAVLDCSKSIFSECATSEVLKVAIPDQICLLLRFGSFAIKPMHQLCPSGKNYSDWAQQFIVPFAEISLRMAVDCFVSTASVPEVVRSQVVVDVVKFLGEPLYIKYQCVSPSTWKLAASSLMTVLRVAVPLARHQGEIYSSLWPAICDTLEKFLFSPNTCHTLAADERKRDELAECQMVELLRNDILPYATSLPAVSVQRLIALLNRGSISQLDPNDVLASDSHMQRSELARTCFDALLSMSSSEASGIGHVAVLSLLERCSHVLVDFVSDSAGAGDLRLPRTRLAEMTAALQAVESLINRLSRDPSLKELYQQLISLYPTVVDVVPCCHDDPQLTAQIVSALKSYQTLMLLKLVPRLT